MNCDRNLYYKSPAYVYEILKEELEKIPYNLNWLKDSIERLIKDYVETIDFESYYFHKKYYFAGLKDGMKL